MPEDDEKTKSDTETPPESEEAKRLQEKKTLAELRRDIAVAEKKELEAKLPASDSKGLDGKTTLADKAGYYAEILAYRTLSDTAAEISKQLGGEVTQRSVILVDTLDFNHDLATWDIIHLRLTGFDQTFDRLLSQTEETPVTESVAPAVSLLAALPSLLGAASDVMSFFRANRTLTGRAVTVSNEALLAEAARHLKGVAKRVVLPGYRLGGSGELVKLLASVQAKRQRAAARHDQLKETLPADEWKKMEPQFQVIAGFDDFLNGITKLPAAGGDSPLDAAVRVDWIRTDPEARILYLKVVSQGGDVETVEKKLGKDRITYLAGTVVVFFLVDTESIVLASGSVPRHHTERFRAD
jgi:hypothetical protein